LKGLENTNPEVVNGNNLGATIRAVESLMVAEGDDEQSLGVSVPYSKLYSLASSTDKCLMYLGWVAAAFTGLGLPSFLFLFGDVLDSFGPTVAPEDALDTITFICILICCIGMGILIFGYIFYTFLLISSERIARKTRIAYF